MGYCRGCNGSCQCADDILRWEACQYNISIISLTHKTYFRIVEPLEKQVLTNGCSPCNIEC